MVHYPGSIEFVRDGAVLETWSGGDSEAISTRAFEIRALPYEIRNPRWKESVLTAFPCREISEARVEVLTPIGTFCLAARRARRGDLKTSFAHGRDGSVGFGVVANADQSSPPVEIHGCLCEPTQYTGWRFQPEFFVYADGTFSDSLGLYPIEIEIEIEAAR